MIHGFGEHLTGGEAEGRIGYVFTRDEGARVRGVFGLMGRAGMASTRSPFEGDRTARVLQLGLFIGFTRAPVGAPGSADETGAPPRGLGLLVPGVVLLAGVVGTIVVDVVTLSGSDGGEGCHPCIPLTLYALPALVPALPLTVVGTIRLRRYRAWKQGITFAPRLTGLAMQF